MNVLCLPSQVGYPEHTGSCWVPQEQQTGLYGKKCGSTHPTSSLYCTQLNTRYLWPYFHLRLFPSWQGWYVGGDNDLVTCFNCFKSLRSWEPCDEPWSEHTRHFPECSFITGQRTANVPLSVTMASTPATMLTHQDVAEEVGAMT